ncbi:MAG: glutaredoxin family protein [Acidobacteriota bacterium]|nr:glutaredoxin family protein [Acidobacteriota bacterium]
MANIKVYGADWCATTKHTRAHLDQLGVPYQYINIDNDREAAAWVAAQNDGKEKKPTLDIDGQVLTAPSNKELDAILKPRSEA